MNAPLPTIPFRAATLDGRPVTVTGRACPGFYAETATGAEVVLATAEIYVESPPETP